MPTNTLNIDIYMRSGLKIKKKKKVDSEEGKGEGGIAKSVYF